MKQMLLIFTYEEENAIRYMSVYVVRELQVSGKCGTTDFLVLKDSDVADATESTARLDKAY